jgi:hypothetical protein
MDEHLRSDSGLTIGSLTQLTETKVMRVGIQVWVKIKALGLQPDLSRAIRDVKGSTDLCSPDG